MEFLNDLFSAYPWGIFVAVALGPFIQEDAAVIVAASASSLGLADPVLLFISIMVGLTLSDLWKYWAGRFGRAHKKADWISNHRNVAKVRDKVLGSLGLTLMATRFIPGTRIPVYLASGFFKAPFGQFSFWIIVSGAVYCLIAFVLFHYLGEVGGEKVRMYAPFVAIALVFVILGVQWLRSRKANQS
ncbi:MAG: hypothetical protein COA60_002370 [Robiginitomaculum sp.]|nr:hypothetical protein [Robiginitomaculum sp.]